MDKKQFETLLQNTTNELNVLKQIDYDGLDEHIADLETLFAEFKAGGDELLSNNEKLQIGIVGQVKAGKSSFLNSLFFEGENILPRASTPMTAGLTVLEYSEDNYFEIEYFTKDEWSIFERQNSAYEKIMAEVRQKNIGAPESMIIRQTDQQAGDEKKSAHEMIAACSSNARSKIDSKPDKKDFKSIKELQGILEKYVGANGEYTSVVKSLHIWINDERLQGMRIVDTPGVNDPVVSRENRTRTFLKSSHGVFLLSASSDFMNNGDITFLNNRIGGEGIGTVVILASKFDSALQDVGAGWSISGKEPEDLADVTDELVEDFRRRIRQLSSLIQSDSLRKNLKFDYTSGIGYSIAHKNKYDWDEMEQHVVKRMQQFYPDYFSNDDDLNQSFDGLANIEDIREKYVEQHFLTRKDEIIKEKISGYFDANIEDIKKKLNDENEYFDSYKQQLEASTVEEIERQKVEQQNLFNNLNDEFKRIIEDCKRELQSKITAMYNEISFADIDSIPEEKVSTTITYEGVLWGHNSSKFTISSIDGNKLKNTLNENLKSFLKKWYDGWKDKVNKTKAEMADKLCDCITEFDKNNVNSSFDDKYYRKLIDRVLSELKSFDKINLNDLKNKFEETILRISEIQIDLNVSKAYNCQEEMVGNIVSDMLREVKKDISSQILSLRKNAVSEARSSVNSQMNGVTGVLDNLKGDFIGKLKADGDKQLAKLEKDLEDKAVVLKKVCSIIDELKKLRALYC